MNSNIEKKDELRKILELLPIKFVRSIAYTKKLTIKSRKKEPIIEELLKLDWNEEEISKLKEIYKTIQREKHPYSTYILKLNKELDLEDIKKKLDANKVVLNNKKTQVTKDGFELISYEPNKSITARYWTHKTKTQLGPLLTLKTDEWDLYTEFVIDIEKGLVFIHSDKPQNAQLTKSTIKEKLNLEIDSINLTHLTSKEAVEKFQIFKNKLEERLKKYADNFKLPLVEIKYLKIYHERGRVKTIILDGREDIMNDKKVKKELKDGGRPILLGGLLRYRGFDFDFKVGHTFGLPNVDFGILQTKKKGAAIGDLSLVEEVYDLILDLYQEIFLKT